jgi:hypothetical protein
MPAAGFREEAFIQGNWPGALRFNFVMVDVEQFVPAFYDWQSNRKRHVAGVALQSLADRVFANTEERLASAAE